jgi:hypothetical protein
MRIFSLQITIVAANNGLYAVRHRIICRKNDIDTLKQWLGPVDWPTNLLPFSLDYGSPRVLHTLFMIEWHMVQEGWLVSSTSLLFPPPSCTFLVPQTSTCTMSLSIYDETAVYEPESEPELDETITDLSFRIIFIHGLSFPCTCDAGRYDDSEVVGLKPIKSPFDLPRTIAYTFYHGHNLLDNVRNIPEAAKALCTALGDEGNLSPSLSIVEAAHK